MLPIDLTSESMRMAIGEIGNVAVIGLGQMGLPMALNLQKAGLETFCFDPSSMATEQATSRGLSVVADVESAFREATFVVLSLPNADIVKTVVETGLTGLSENAPAPIVIDASTSTAEMTRHLAPKLRERGGDLVDAPVSGGPTGSRDGTLTFMVGGEAAAIDRCRPIFDILGKTVLVAGPTGAGNVAKLVNNLMVAGHMLIARDAMALAKASGLDLEAALEVVNAASGGSTISKVHFPGWVVPRSFDSGFTMALMRKDLRLADELAAESGLSLPIGTQVVSLWNEGNAPADEEDFTRMGDPQPLLNSENT
ncbi:NAD(P)-dependent oxidoreductase [Fulvimarina sp. MAC3]|uniref:NAD(P)-dependent oxidoreductase n=1 Tax=Fulvimarina sp. MAC3 TaxID=3148887 RepID=UPI0031FDD054